MFFLLLISPVLGQQSIDKGLIPFTLGSDGTLSTLRNVTIHNPVTFIIPKSYLDNLPSTSSPLRMVINFGHGAGLRELNTATIQNDKAIWTINYSSFGDKEISIDIVSPNSPGSLFFKTVSKITVKQPQVAYAQPDAVWTITTTQTWQPPTELNSAYPSAASSNLDALFNSNSQRDIALLSQLRGSSIGKANAYIKYGNGNTERKLKKPFIVIDGIDFGSYALQYTDAAVTSATDPNNHVIRYGDVGWDLLQTGTDESKLDPDDPSDREFLQNYPQLFNTLLAEGYDIVFLDFERGADYIQKNAWLLIELIRKVNQEKLYHDCQHQNVVLGASMGGQVARYALRRMEILGEDHETRTYVSFDSPQKGANIPLSIQAAALWLHRAGAALATTDLSLWQKLNLPAARQLIVKQLGTEMLEGSVTASKWDVPNPPSISLENMSYFAIRNQYVAEIGTIGYPRNTRNLALACGSFSGASQGYAGGSQIFNATVGGSGNGYSATVACLVLNSAGQQLANTDLIATSVPCDFRPSGFPTNMISAITNSTTRSTSGTNILFGAAIPSSFCRSNGDFNFPCEYSNAMAIISNSPTAQFDNAPGGYRQDLVQVKGLLNTIADGFLTNGFSVDFHNLPGLTNKKQAFISVLSAFGLNQEMDNINMFQNFETNEETLKQLKITPFDEIFAPSENLKHVEINQEMITWLMGKIQLQGGSVPSSLINQSYNFANQSVNEIPQVLISAGSTVKINGNGGAGLGNEPNNAPNPFTVSTSQSCRGSRITVGQIIGGGQTNGIFQVGEGTRVGILQIRDQGVMTIRQGATLKIEHNSQIVIENGGSLVINAGANVNLVGLESKIIVKQGGELVINGQFNFSGNGYFRFEQGNVFTLSNTVILGGTGINNRLIFLADGARLNMINGGLNLQNCLVEGEATTFANTPLERIIVNPMANFSAVDVNFKENTNIGQKIFIVLDNSLGNRLANFERCTFDIKGVAVDMRSVIAVNTGNFGTAQVNFTNCLFDNSASFQTDRARAISLNNCRFNGGYIRVGNVWHLDLVTIEMRGANSASIAVKVENVLQSVISNCIIDSYTNSGVDASSGMNVVVAIQVSTIQNCFWGIRMNGGLNHPYSVPQGALTDYGLIDFECTRFLNNNIDIDGDDILMQFTVEDGLSNIFTRNVNDTDSRLFNINYRCRRPNFIDFGFAYLDGFLQTATATSINNWWTFRQSGCNPSRTPNPYDGALLLADIQADPATPNVTDCGGLTLRGNRKNPLDSGIIVRINGISRNLKIQYDAAMKKIKKGNTEEGVTLFANLASLQNNLRDTASPAVKHIISVARVFSGATATTLRSANDGWLPETLVEIPKEATDVFIVSPNPANTEVQLTIKSGNYHLRVSNAVGQTIFAQNTEGPLSVNVATWTNGIYLFELTDKATNKQQRRKIVVQH